MKKKISQRERCPSDCLIEAGTKIQTRPLPTGGFIDTPPPQDFNTLTDVVGIFFNQSLLLTVRNAILLCAQAAYKQKRVYEKTHANIILVASSRISRF